MASSPWIDHATAMTLLLWPSSVFKHLPADGFQTFTVLSLPLALARSQSIDHDNAQTWPRLARARGHVPYLDLRVSGCRHDSLTVGRKLARCASTPRSHSCRCGRASLCGHGHGGLVRACRIVRARARHACYACARPAADAPSRARRLCRADAWSSCEGAARQRLCADEAGESWSVWLGASLLHVPLFVACGCSGVANSPCSARCWWRFQVQGCIRGVCRQRCCNRKFAPPSSLSKTRQQCNTQYAPGPGNEHPPCAFLARFDARPSTILATRRSYNLCAL